MTPEAWRANEAQNRAHARAAQQDLAAALRQAGARVTMMDGVPGLPDMVFPANAAIVLNGRAMVARFRHHERQGEERHFFSQFMRLRDEGVLWEVAYAPKGCWQEGAGDCIWDASRQLFWAGFGPRSSFDAIAAIKDYFGAPVIPLELVSGQYYHLDTCFAPLSGGEILYYPPAFSKMSLAAIKDRVPADALIEASDEDAAALRRERGQYRPGDRHGRTFAAPCRTPRRARLQHASPASAPLHHVGRRRLLHDAAARPQKYLPDISKG